MMKFNTGKLFQVKKYFWLLYPSKDIAAAAWDWIEAIAHAVAASDVASAECYSQAWSKQYNCNVTFVSPNDIFCLLEQDGKYLKILSTNGELGWINHPTNDAWTKGCIEEVNQ
jgi:hypothetical protein